MFHCAKTQKGFALLAVLIFMQIFTLLSLSGLMAASLAIKKSQHQWQRDTSLLKAQRLLSEIENYVLAGGDLCRVNPLEPASLVTRPINWWQRVSCSGNLADIRYYYAIEFLGKDTCSVIWNNFNHQAMIAENYRITLLVLLDKLKGAKIILQSTLLKACDEISTCPGKIHWVHAGRQTRRELI